MTATMRMRPKCLFVSLQKPAKCWLGKVNWHASAQVYIDGLAAEGNDTPWCATVSDLLVEDGRFVGMTFPIDDNSQWEQARRIAEGLDQQVVRYDDISTARSRQRYVGHEGKIHRFEVTWHRAQQARLKLAQLCCGEWFWWYPKGTTEESPPVIALGIIDVEDVLHEHDLTLPDIGLPSLNVEFA